jgi:hypothetical protein
MWTFAPDNRIKEHPVRFGTADGEWTAVTGWLEVTFMFEEFLFWDNGEFMKQIGLAQ